MMGKLGLDDVVEMRLWLFKPSTENLQSRPSRGRLKQKSIDCVKEALHLSILDRPRKQTYTYLWLLAPKGQ